jgi:hypothetical protein
VIHVSCKKALNDAAVKIRLRKLAPDIESCLLCLDLICHSSYATEGGRIQEYC